MATRKKRTKPERLRPTAVDYLVVGLVPALIIGMICGLVFFLVLAFYQGDYNLRLMYLFGLFTLATVLVARIASEEGRGYAAMFSIPLGLASLLTINTFAKVDGPLAGVSWLINGFLLALIWFLADRITFDCSVIDERAAGSQQGLLQSLGMLKKEKALVSAPRIGTPKKKDGKDKPHNPGVWVMYFALLALPLFGLGQLVIPESTSGAFICLMIYLGCALCLLASTSFISMRRYIRQKGVEMPVEITSRWLPLSIASIAAVLVIGLVLPLPGRSLGLVGSPITFNSGDLDSSQFGWGNEGSGDESNAAAAKTEGEDGAPEGAASKDGKGNPQASDDGESKSNQSGGDESGGKGGDQADKSDGPQQQESGQQSSDDSSKSEPETGKSQENSSNNEGSSGDNQQADSNDTTAEEKQNQSPDEEQGKPNEASNENDESKDDGAGQDNSQDSSKSGSSNPGSSPRPSFIPNITGSISEMFKWITILILATIVVIYAITHPEDVKAMWAAIRNFFANLFGSKEQTVKQAAPARIAPPTPRRPFRDFANPFTSGQSLTADMIISHTYLALQAWAEEHGTKIADETTPTELADQLGRLNPSVGKHSQILAHMVNKLLFSRWTPAAEDVTPLRKLWHVMSSS